MSIENCIRRTREYVKQSDLLKDKIDNQKIEMMARFVESQGGDALNAAELGAKLEEFQKTHLARAYAENEAANAMILYKREKGLKGILENIQNWKADPKSVVWTLKSQDQIPSEAFRAWVQGDSLRPGVDTNINVNRMAAARAQALKESFRTNIASIYDTVTSAKVDKDAMTALWEMDHKLPITANGNPDALTFAKAIREVQDKKFLAESANNPYLHAREGYLVRPYWQPDKVMAMGREGFAQFMMEHYGKNTFPGNSTDEKMEAFKDSYDKIVNGKYGSAMDLSDTDKYITIKGAGGNLMKMMSKGRVFIPNDLDGAWAAHSQLGPGTLYDGINRMIEQSSRNIAQMDKFSVNPRAVYEGMKQRIYGQLEGKEAEAFKGQMPTFDKQFAQLMGAQNTPADGIGARWARGIMAQQYAAKGGAGILRAFPDLAVGGSLLRDTNGESVLSNATKLMGAVSRAMVGGEEARGKEFAKLDMFTSVQNADMMQKLGTGEEPGKMAKMAQLAGKIFLHQQWVDSMRLGVSAYLGSNVADQRLTPFKELSARWQQGLNARALGGAAWEAIRTAEPSKVHGLDVITPESIRNISDDAAERYLLQSKQFKGQNTQTPQFINYAKDQLATLYSQMLQEHSSLASMQPSDRTKYFMWSDTDMNTPEGIMRRLIFQFKSAGITTNDVVRRSALSGPNTGPKGDLSGVAQLATGLLFATTVGHLARQYMAGPTPEDPLTPGFGIKMMAMSGAAGLGGDVVADVADRHGLANKAIGLASGMLGPVLGTGFEATILGAQKLTEVAGGEKPDRTVTNRATNLALGQIPLINTFYSKSVYNYYIANSVKNFMGDGGYLDHLENSVTGQPSWGGTYFGGPNRSYMWGQPTSEKPWGFFKGTQ